MAEDEQNAMVEVRALGALLDKPFIAGGTGKIHYSELIREAEQAAQDRDPTRTADALRTARYLVRDAGLDPTELDPAFRILGKQAKAEDQNGQAQQ